MPRNKTTEESLDIGSQETGALEEMLDPPCEDFNAGPTYEELLEQNRQLQESLTQSSVLIQNQQSLIENYQSLDQESEAPAEDGNEIVEIWVSSDAPGIVKKTGFDDVTGESYPYFEFSLCYMPTGSYEHRMTKFTIPIDQRAEVPRFVYEALNDGPVRRASLIQSSGLS